MERRLQDRRPLHAGVTATLLALLAAWLAWTLLLFAVSGRGVLSTSVGVSHEPFRNFFAGLTGVLALFLTALLFSAFAAVLVGVPLLLMVVPAPVPNYEGQLAPAFIVFVFESLFQAEGEPLLAGLILLVTALVGIAAGIFLGRSGKPERPAENPNN